MSEVIITSMAIKVAMAFMALLVIWGLFRLLDRSTGLPFYKAMEIMYENPVALAVYYGLRFLGACFLIGLLLS